MTNFYVLTGVECLFAMHNKKMYEIMKYKEKHRSWFINDTVQKGSF